jgi:WD40 repeat protein
MKKILLLCMLASFGNGAAVAATYVDLPISAARDHAFDGDVLYVTSGQQLHSYSLSKCTHFPPRSLGQQLLGVEASPNGRYVAVANRGLVDGQVRVFLIDKARRTPRIISYPPQSLESGSYMVSWESTGTLLISGTFAGSGWTPLRRYDPVTGLLSQVQSVRQDTMLSASTGYQVTALAESNLSSGPAQLLAASASNYSASTFTNWFVFEIAASTNAGRVAVPTYAGMFVYERQQAGLAQVGTIGVYADHGPVAAAFSPDDRRLVTASYAWTANATQQGVIVYDAQSLERITTIDPYPFGWVGNAALGAGRLTLSPDGNWLAVTLNDRVRLYDVHAELGDPGRSPSACTSPVPGYDDYAAERSLQQAVDRADPRNVDARGWFSSPTTK